MVETLVWILIATGGSYNGSSIMQPLFFKTEAQCLHVAANVAGIGGIINKPKCIQANILVTK